MNAAFAAGPSERQSELFATWHLARRRSLPLLVVVFDPADFVRGDAVGGALGEASDPLMAALDSYLPVCATREDLLLLGVRVPDDAWFAIVDTAGRPAAGTLIDGKSLWAGNCGMGAIPVRGARFLWFLEENHR